MTEGATEYTQTSFGAYDEVFKVELYVRNDGNVLTSFTPTLAFTHGEGTHQVITWTVGVGKATTTVSTVVTLDGSDASLGYIPGTSVLTHNPSSSHPSQYISESVGDSVLFAPTDPIATLGTGYAYESYVTAQLRVRVSGVTINATARHSGSSPGPWLPTLYARPSEKLPIRVTIGNTGNVPLIGLVGGISLPKGSQIYGKLTVKAVQFNGSEVLTQPTLGNLSPVQGLLATSFDVGTMNVGSSVEVDVLVSVPRASTASPSVVWAFLNTPTNYYWNVLDIHVEE